LGIHCYGFEPFLLDRAESATVHGDNERISVKNVRYGLRFYYEVVEKTAR
jgi:acetylornithine deacetylase/succinyl-diaminopimelate desuccinylase-like protein